MFPPASFFRCFCRYQARLGLVLFGHGWVGIFVGLAGLFACRTVKTVPYGFASRAKNLINQISAAFTSTTSAKKSQKIFWELRGNFFPKDPLTSPRSLVRVAAASSAGVAVMGAFRRAFACYLECDFVVYLDHQGVYLFLGVVECVECRAFCY